MSEEGREDVGKEWGGKVRRRRKRIEDCHLLSARYRHSLPPDPKLPPHCLSCSSPRVLSVNHEAKCTSNRTITTSILNKITPAAPVWLMGRVWEQRRRDKLPAAACSISHTPGSIHRRGTAWGVEPNIEPTRAHWHMERESLAATAAAVACAHNHCVRGKRQLAGFR